MEKIDLINRMKESIKEKYNKDRPIFLLKIGFIILIVLFIFFPLLLFWFIFGFNGFSNDFNNWVNFATYISGTLTPILAIINIIVLYQLTRTAKKIEQRNIATQLRKEEYVQIKKEIDRFIKEDKFKDNEEIKKIIISIDSFIDDYNFLFPHLKDNKVSKNIFNVLEKLKKDKANILGFIDAKDKFLQYIQSEFLLNTK